MGSDLYKHLNTYFVTHLKEVRAAAEDLSDEPLLNYYTKEWDRYTTGASYVNRLFTYLNRHWVKREKDEGRKNVYVVYIVRYTAVLSSSLSPCLYPRANDSSSLAARPRPMEGPLLQARPEQAQAHFSRPQAHREAAQRRDDRIRLGQEGHRLVRCVVVLSFPSPSSLLPH
jgi:hypothetical protein